MKEVSLLLGTLCKLLPSQTEPSDGLITVEQVGKNYYKTCNFFLGDDEAKAVFRMFFLKSVFYLRKVVGFKFLLIAMA